MALNFKARKVNNATLETISQHVDVEDIYVTKTIEQSDQSLDEIIRKRYPLVFCGGGDGTVMRIIEQMRFKVDAHNKAGGDYEYPKFAMLKMGTGNGWAGILGVPPGVKPIWYIRQKRAEELRFTKFNMIECDGRMFHFGGFGVDAMILNDYIDMKNRFTEGFMWKMSNSLAGYLMALAGKSVPRVLLKGFKIKVRLINLSDEPVYKASHSEGLSEMKAGKNECFFEGEVDAAIFGTTTDYGFKLKVMPFAMHKEGFFSIRASTAGAAKILANLKDVWLGTWDDPGFHDFLVKHMRVEVDGDAPFQLGGDPEGKRGSVELKVSDFTPELLDFRK